MTAPDLVAFLAARLDEDEWAVREWIEPRTGPGDQFDFTTRVAVELADRLGAERMLAEIDAKRRIIDLHNRCHRCPSSLGFWWNCPDLDEHGASDGSDLPCPTLRLLALPYADHPDHRYREEWKP